MTATPPLFPEGTFYILRHGESEANAKGIFAGGQIDSPLTEKGTAGAIEAASVLQHLNLLPKTIIASIMQRAEHTAGIIAKAIEHTSSVITEHGLKERDWGDVSGKPKKEYPKEHPHRKAPPNGETIEAFRKRSNHTLARALANHQSQQPILIVAHRGTIEAITSAFGLEFPTQPENARVYKVTIGRNRTKSTEPIITIEEYRLQNERLQQKNVRLIAPQQGAAQTI